MVTPISAHTASRIRELAQQLRSAPLDRIAKLAKVSVYHVRHVLGGDPRLADDAEIQFREVGPYRCVGCDRDVCLRPCPACVARSYRVAKATEVQQ